MSYVGKITDTAGNTHLVGSTLYGTCTTGVGTAAKVVTCANFDKLETGVTIHVKFSNSNTASNPTLNVNSTGAKPIYMYGTTAVETTTSTSWQAGAVVSFTYDGTGWMMNYGVDKNTDTKNTAGSTNSSSALYLIGASTQGANPQTHSNSAVYQAQGYLYANGFNDVSLTNANNGVTIAGNTDNNAELFIPKNKSYTLGDACEKGVDSTITAGSSSTNLPTTSAVAAYVASQITGASAYQGAVDAESDLLNVALTAGWYYVVTMPNAQTTYITIGGEVCEAGDMIFVNTAGTYTTSSALGAAIDVVQNNIETLTTTEIDAIWTAA